MPAASFLAACGLWLHFCGLRPIAAPFLCNPIKLYKFDFKLATGNVGRTAALGSVAPLWRF